MTAGTGDGDEVWTDERRQSAEREPSAARAAVDWAAIHHDRERSIYERAARRVSARGVNECAGVGAPDDDAPSVARLRF